MPIIYVKPREGGRVRMPDRNFTVMPASGDFVEHDTFYERLIIGGDVVVCDPPKPMKPTAEAAPTPEPAPAARPSAAKK